MVAGLYRQRWTVETMFQELTQHLGCEVNTLGYPKAALFAFCVALVAYNVLAVVKAALRSVHGESKVESEVSGYYLALEISRMYAGMMVAIPEEHWQVFQRCSRKEMVHLLRKLAKGICLARYRKQRRSPKKPAQERTYNWTFANLTTAARQLTFQEKSVHYLGDFPIPRFQGGHRHGRHRRVPPSRPRSSPRLR